MIRIFSRALGDNAPAYARLILPTIFGSGQVFVSLGYRPCTGTVSFSRMFDEKSAALFAQDPENHDDPVVFIGYYDSYSDAYADPFTSDGMWLSFRNVPELDGSSNPLGLDVNYIAEA